MSDKRKSSSGNANEIGAKKSRTSTAKDVKSSQPERRHGKPPSKLDKSTAKSFVKNPVPAPIPQNNAEKKALTRAKKEAKNPNFALFQECVNIWEELRPRDATADDKGELVAKVVSKAKGKFKELSMNHSSSRVVQAVLKHGTPAHRQIIWEDCKEDLVGLSRSQHGNFVVRKLIATAKKDQLPAVLRAFKGSIPGLFKHPCAAAVLAELYEVLPPKERNVMVAEFYSKEYMLFGSANSEAGSLSSLIQAWEGMDAQKRRTVMQQLMQSLQPIIEKNMVESPAIHRLVSEYMQLAPSSMIEDVVELLSSEVLFRMVHTHEGCRVGCMVAAYGSPKDRKKLIKGLKGHVAKVCLDEFAYLVFVKVISSVDDTQLMKKGLVPELLTAVPELCESKHGSKVILYLLHPNNSRYLPPHALKLLSPAERTITSTAQVTADPVAGNTSEDAKPVSQVMGLSKKEPELRRCELLGSGKGSLTQALVDHCEASTAALLATPQGADIIAELCMGSYNGALWESSSSDINRLHAAVAEAAADGDSAPMEESDEPPTGPLLESYFGSRAIRKVLLESKADGLKGKAASAFATCLWESAVQGRCEELLKGHAAKIVAAIVTSGDSETGDAARDEVKGCVQDVDAWLESFEQKPRVAKGKDVKVKVAPKNAKNIKSKGGKK